MVEVVKVHKAFGGSLTFYKHPSTTTNCSMSFGIFRPANLENPSALWFLAGLTCDEKRFSEKCTLGLKAAAEAGVALVFPDTSPRAIDIPGV
jgi:S-formylglutathione hydrolase